MATRTERTGTASGGGAAQRDVPERSPEFAHLTLDGLRVYRHALTDEENRVSYWRRLIQARLDLLAQSGEEDLARLERLRGLLAETRVGVGRRALVDVMPVDDAPPLPDLHALWSQEVRLDDPVRTAALRKDLSFAELQLSAYRAALHRRLGRATRELIARYREDPSLALTALPLGPADRGA